jgi:subtilase family serine protease
VSAIVPDLRKVEFTNGLPQVPVNFVQVTAPTSDTGGQIEWNIDTQSSTGMAGVVKSVTIYNFDSLADGSIEQGFNRFASDDIAQVGNASFGGCEFVHYALGMVTTADLTLAETVAQGQTVFASSGDAGSACGVSALPPVSGPFSIPSVEYPASSPYVMSVGGTSTMANRSDGSYLTETVWKGGGGGVSYIEHAAPWQSSLGPFGLPYEGPRLVPDIAMTGDPWTGLLTMVNGSVQVGWGGTSLASPMSMGVYARLLSRHPELGNAAAALYGPYVASGGGFANVLGGQFNSAFYPKSLTPAVIGGFNDVFLGANGEFQAYPGFDETTGMGSFNINSLFVWWGS